MTNLSEPELAIHQLRELASLRSARWRDCDGGTRSDALAEGRYHFDLGSDRTHDLLDAVARVSLSP